MLIQRMARKFLSVLMWGNVGLRYQRNVDLLKISAAKTYITGIKSARFLLIGVLILFITMALFVCGLALVHTSLFTYSPFSAQTKWIAALLLGTAELALAVAAMIYLVKESTWVKFTGIDRMVNSITKDKNGRRGGRYETKTR